MPFSDFTFQIDASGFSPQIETLSFEDSKDRELKVFIRKVTSRFIFSGEEFEALYNQYESTGECYRLDFDINYQSSGYAEASLNIGGKQLEWDLDKCRVTARVDERGEWQCISDNWEDEFNIFDAGTTSPVEPILGELEYAFCSEFSSTQGQADGCLSGDGWTILRNTVEKFNDDPTFTINTTWVREKVVVSCAGGVPVPPAGDGWILEENNCGSNGTAVYVRGLNSTIDREESIFDDGNEGYIIVYSIAQVKLPETVDNGVLLNDILTTFNPCGDLTIVSDFFGINADGTAPDNGAYTSADAYCKDIVVFQKTDIKNIDADQNAINGFWNWRSLMNHLKYMFNVEGRIIGSSYRIEHISYFENAMQDGIDLTAGEYAQYLNGDRVYTRNESGIYKREKWKFMEDVSENFIGAPIIYKDCLDFADTNEQVYPMDQVNNDITYIINNPDGVADDGFVFAATHRDGSNNLYFLYSDLGAGVSLLNGFFSIGKLIEQFHYWDRPLPVGYISNTEIIFESSTPRKQQNTITVKIDRETFRDLEPSNRIKTNLGWGEVVKIEYDAKNCVAKLDLVYV